MKRLIFIFSVIAFTLPSFSQDSTVVKPNKIKKSEFGFSLSTFLVPKLKNNDLIIINDKQKLSYGANLFFNRHITPHFGYSVGLSYYLYKNNFSYIITKNNIVLDTMKWYLESYCFSIPLKLFYTTDCSKKNYLVVDACIAPFFSLSEHNHSKSNYMEPVETTGINSKLYTYCANISFVHKMEKLKLVSSLCYINNNSNVGINIYDGKDYVLAKNHMALSVGLLF